MDGNCQVRSTVGENPVRLGPIKCSCYRFPLKILVHFQASLKLLRAKNCVSLDPNLQTQLRSPLGRKVLALIQTERICQVRLPPGRKVLAQTQTEGNCQLRTSCYVRSISGDICYLRSSFGDVCQLRMTLKWLGYSRSEKYCYLSPNDRLVFIFWLS